VLRGRLVQPPQDLIGPDAQKPAFFDRGNPVSVRHSGNPVSKSGVSSSFLPEKMNRRRITGGISGTPCRILCR